MHIVVLAVYSVDMLPLMSILCQCLCLFCWLFLWY